MGAYLSDALLTTLGICAYLLVGLFFLASFLKFIGKSFSVRWAEGLYYIAFVFFTATFLHLQFPQVHIAGQPFPGGGFIGSLGGEIMIRYLNRPGAYVVTVTGMVLFFILATEIQITAISINIYRLTKYFFWNASQWSRVRLEWVKGWMAKSWKKLEAFMNRWAENLRKKKRPAIQVTNKILSSTTSTPAKEEAAAIPPATRPVATTEPKIFARADTETKIKTDHQLKLVKMSSGYTTPPVSLLDAEEKKITIDEGVLKKNAQLLELKLKDYDVEGHVTEIHPGPIITMYEFEPAAGTKVNKIVNLESDLSLNMGGRSVRILPHLPGKAAVGIEIPNAERETVWLKEIIGSEPFQKTKARLPLALGKDTEGHPMVSDLTKMPHLLVAGATGSGKSVAINTMIISMIYKVSPQQVRFILVDPKMLELKIYEGIPHLLLPVVTQPKKAIVAMRWAVREMERRYRLLADAAVRNIAGYNEKVAKGQVPLISEEEAEAKQQQDKEAVCHTGPLYYLVIIIDELADLMMVSSQEMEETITRLAQMARASGIHLVLATQRPSVDVITGLIKANFPARISFKVSSKYDSRTILDQMGAETLLGAGDMLFVSPSGQGMSRIHGALITETEIQRIVDFVKEQGSPEYKTSILETPAESETDEFGAEEENDELYDQAVRMVTESRQASISLVQRRLRIGYNRAARLIERMEKEGVVGPADGSKPREILAAPQ